MTRNDTHYLTRDDVLRELELLPAWKLRAPHLQQEVMQIATEKVLQERVIEEKVPAEEAIEPAPALPQKLDTDFEIHQSENNMWVFICAASRMDTALQSMLLNNIFAALQIKAKKYDVDLATIQAKVMVAMGESVAQTLLNSQDSLENLRGKLHSVGATKVITSDDLAHLIANPQHKVKLWQDLCLARTYLESLQS